MASRPLFKLIGQRVVPSKAAAISLFSLALVMMLAIAGCVQEEDLTLEQRAHQLYGQLMCPVCDGQTIDGSNATVAQNMRAKVLELLEEGMTNAEVKDYFVLRYKEEILAAPGGGGFNLLAWIVPFFIAGGGIGIALLAVRNMRRSSVRRAAESAAGPGTGAGMATATGDLSDYLAEVDRDLGISDEPLDVAGGPSDPEPRNEVDS